MSSSPCSSPSRRSGSMAKGVAAPPAAWMLHCCRSTVSGSPCAPAAASASTFRSGRQADGQHAVLEAVAKEDVAEARRDHAAHAQALQRPDRGLTGRAAAEVGAGQQDRRVRGTRRLVEDEVGVVDCRRGGSGSVPSRGSRDRAGRPCAPFSAGEPFDARTMTSVSTLARIRWAAADRRRRGERLHGHWSLPRAIHDRPGDRRRHRSMAGLARWVRAARPLAAMTKLRGWRSTPGERPAAASTCSPLAATHMLQPGSRHTKPARLEDAAMQAFGLGLRASRPRSRARHDPGGRRRAATVPAPRARAAAARRSDSRELAQEPMKTRSTLSPAIDCPGARGPCLMASALAASVSRRVAVGARVVWTSGTWPSIAIACSGLVPQVMVRR